MRAPLTRALSSRSRVLLFSLSLCVVFLLSSAAFMRNWDWADDIVLWKDAANKGPGTARAYANLATAYAKKELFPEAIAMSMKSLSIRANPIAYDCLGTVYLRQGRMDEALAAYSKAIALQPHSAQYTFNRGIVFFQLARYDRAIADYTTALSLHPRYIEAYMNRGNAYDEYDMPEKALEDYGRALDVDPSYADAYYNRAVTLRKMGKRTEARADLALACSLGSADACTTLSTERTW